MSDHLHRDRAIGEEHGLADLEVVRQRAIGATQMMRVASRIRLDLRTNSALEVAGDHAAGDLLEANLGPQRSCKTADGCPSLPKSSGSPGGVACAPHKSRARS